MSNGHWYIDKVKDSSSLCLCNIAYSCVVACNMEQIMGQTEHFYSNCLFVYIYFLIFAKVSIYYLTIKQSSI